MAHYSGLLHKASILSFALIILLATAGGYALSRVIYGMNDDAAHYAGQLLVIDESLDDASILLGRQIQDWKDMLMRADDAQAYGKHQKGFVDASVGVQNTLVRTQTAMQSIGMDTAEISRLSVEHKALLSNYLSAHSKLKPRQIESSREVDRQVAGVDRSLQQHLASVRADIERQTRNQLQAVIPARGQRYLLAGLLTAALLFMAFLGFALASLLHVREERMAAY